MLYSLIALLDQSKRPTYKLPNSPDDNTQTNGVKVSYTDIPSIDSVASLLSTASMEGVRVIDEIIFEAGSYKRLGINGVPEYVSYQAYRLPATSTLEVALTKTIIRTPVVNATGTFQEIVGHDDYQVTIRGIILAVDETDRDAQIERLMQFVGIDAPIEVTCGFLEAFKISRLVVERVSFAESRGAPLRKEFELFCYSSITPVLVEKITARL